MTDPVQGYCGNCLLQAGIPSLDWSEALKIHKGQIGQSHHNAQLWMGPQSWGQVPGQPEGGTSGSGDRFWEHEMAWWLRTIVPKQLYLPAG